MIKIMSLGVVVIFVFSFVLSQGHAWGALLAEILGAAWLIYCMNKYHD